MKFSKSIYTEETSGWGRSDHLESIDTPPSPSIARCQWPPYVALALVPHLLATVHRRRRSTCRVRDVLTFEACRFPRLKKIGGNRKKKDQSRAHHLQNKKKEAAYKEGFFFYIFLLLLFGICKWPRLFFLIPFFFCYRKKRDRQSMRRRLN